MERKWVLELRWTPKGLRSWLALVLVLASSVEVGSDSVTLNAVYPSPIGIYTNLSSTGQTILARDGGSVGVGTTNPLAKLDVIGIVRMQGADVQSVIQMRGGGPWPGKFLMASDSLGTARWEYCTYAP